MANKIITFDDHFSTGEPTVQLVSTWGRNGHVLRENTSIHKIASIRSPALDYIKSVEPEPGKTTVLIIGLGDHETYGPNRNGDGFPSEPVPGKIAADEVLTKHYQTYKNAHVYRHHVNNDPAKAIGRVKEAFWNPHMRRVEVVEDFDHSKAPDLLEKIAAGEHPAKSMGCRIKYDTCTICGNNAKNRSEYCDHLKYEMGKIDANTGKQAAALNPSPNFFDSSWVIRPADRTGYMLKKVAYAIRTSSYELGEQVEDLKQKSAEIGKSADIEKVLTGRVDETHSNLDKDDVALLSKYKDKVLPDAAKKTAPLKIKGIQIIIKHDPGDVLETTEGLGMPLGLGELLKFFTSKMSPEIECDDKIVKSASAHMALMLDTLREYPRFCDELMKLGKLDEGTFNEKLAADLSPYVPQRATSDDYLSRRFVPQELRGVEEPRMQAYTYTDPNTGAQYKTNLHAVQNMHDRLTEREYKTKMMKATPLLGASALLGATAMGLGAGGKASRGRAIAAGLGSIATGLYGGHQLLKPTELSGPMVMTDQGRPISGWTEMTRTASTPRETSYMLRRAIDGDIPKLAASTLNNLRTRIKKAVILDEDSPVLGPTLDLDKVAQIIGESILAFGISTT